MPRPRGVPGRGDNLTVLPLSDGDSITVKTVLTAGESRDISSKSIRGYSDGGKTILPDDDRLTFMAAATYIVHWTFVDLHHKPIAWVENWTLDQKIAVLRSLDEGTLKEIEEALEAHRKGVLAEQEKNAPSGESGIERSSPSAA